jgi:hypothetical protein
MIVQIRFIIGYIFSLSTIFIINYPIFSKGKLIDNLQEVQKYDTSIEVSNGIYKLELKSTLIIDTLNEEWKDDKFWTPLLERQSLHFYKNGIEINRHLFPIEHIIRTNKHDQKLCLVAIPIFDICILKGPSADVFYVYGAEFCNGVECPEFLGLYSMSGDELYENISTQKRSVNLVKLEDIIKEYRLHINEPDTCQTILDIWDRHW